MPIHVELGILISKSGFQQRTMDAAYCSEVLLKDWDGFIDMISNQWIYHRLMKLKHLLRSLSVYIVSVDEFALRIPRDEDYKFNQK